MVDIRSGFTFYLLKKKEKNPVSFLPRALFTLAMTSALHSRHLKLVFFNHQGQNRITIQPNRVFFSSFSDNNFYQFMTLVKLLN